MTEVAKTQAWLRRLSEDALRSPRVTVIEHEPIVWLGANSQQFDVAIVDLGLPKLPGLEVIRRHLDKTDAEIARIEERGRVAAALERIGPWSITALLLTLVLLFAFQGEAILAQPLVIALLAVPILIQVYFNSALAYLLNRALGEQHQRPRHEQQQHLRLHVRGDRDGLQQHPQRRGCARRAGPSRGWAGFCGLPVGELCGAIERATAKRGGDMGHPD